MKRFDVIVKEFETKKVVKVIGEGLTAREKERVLRGASLKVNFDKYYIDVIER